MPLSVPQNKMMMVSRKSCAKDGEDAGIVGLLSFIFQD